mmetsp:Transcript_865/g.1937  ORF Transcript_865/g.1937 Transcript_865/m.1937 type:complete len:581 (+) Transcript_865:1978-3720(+)
MNPTVGVVAEVYFCEALAHAVQTLGLKSANMEAAIADKYAEGLREVDLGQVDLGHVVSADLGMEIILLLAHCQIVGDLHLIHLAAVFVQEICDLVWLPHADTDEVLACVSHSLALEIIVLRLEQVSELIMSLGELALPLGFHLTSLRATILTEIRPDIVDLQDALPVLGVRLLIPPALLLCTRRTILDTFQRFPVPLLRVGFDYNLHARILDQLVDHVSEDGDCLLLEPLDLELLPETAEGGDGRLILVYLFENNCSERLENGHHRRVWPREMIVVVVVEIDKTGFHFVLIALPEAARSFAVLESRDGDALHNVEDDSSVQLLTERVHQHRQENAVQHNPNLRRHKIPILSVEDEEKPESRLEPSVPRTGAELNNPDEHEPSHEVLPGRLPRQMIARLQKPSEIHDAGENIFGYEIGRDMQPNVLSFLAGFARARTVFPRRRMGMFAGTRGVVARANLDSFREQHHRHEQQLGEVVCERDVHCAGDVVAKPSRDPVVGEEGRLQGGKGFRHADILSEILHDVLHDHRGLFSAPWGLFLCVETHFLLCCGPACTLSFKGVTPPPALCHLHLPFFHDNLRGH